MEKHFNKNHEAIIYSDFKDVLDTNKDYLEGEEIEQKELVNHVKFFTYHDSRLVEVYLYRDMIVDLYNQINDIEKTTRKGKYSNLPF